MASTHRLVGKASRRAISVRVAGESSCGVGVVEEEGGREEGNEDGSLGDKTGR